MSRFDHKLIGNYQPPHRAGTSTVTWVDGRDSLSAASRARIRYYVAAGPQACVVKRGPGGSTDISTVAGNDVSGHSPIVTR